MLLDKLALSLVEDRVITDLSFQFPNLTAICSDGSTIVLNIGNACPAVVTTASTSSSTSTSSTSSGAVNEVIALNAIVAGPTAPTPGTQWGMSVTGAVPGSSFYFTSGAGFTSPAITISSNGTGSYGYFTYASAGTFTVTAYFASNGHTRTATATVSSGSATSSSSTSSTTPIPGATYTLRAAGATTTTVSEGTVVTLTLATTNVPNGTRLSYIAAGISAGMTDADLSGHSGLNGGANFLTTGNSTNFQFTVVADFSTEGPEWVDVAVCPYYTAGVAPAALSNAVRVNVTDSSVGASTTTTTQGVPAGTVLKISTSQSWVVPAGWTRARAIIVAGGGGGGTLGTSGYYDGGGGGGAGGVIDVTLDVYPGTSMAAVIGAGGAAGDNNAFSGRGRNGGDTTFAFQTAVGGGGGGGLHEVSPSVFDSGLGKAGQWTQAVYDFHGLQGGSGGGSTAPFAIQANYNAPPIAGQGNLGGEAFDNGMSGGGGGAGSRGRGNGGLSWGPNKNAAGVSDPAVSGGSGLGYTFAGGSFVVGGGGGLGGNTWSADPSITRIGGGWGGGGLGDGGTAGSANTGGGGGGGSAWWGGNNTGGAGGSGVIYLVKV